MALRASSSAPLPSTLTSLSPPPKSTLVPSKFNTSSRSHQLTLPNSLSLSATAIPPLFLLLSTPHEARAQVLAKDQIVSTLTQVESTIDGIQELGSIFFSSAGQVLGAVTKAVKPGFDVALPILEGAGKQAVKIASPLLSDASNKAQEAIQSTGIDTQPMMNAAKMVVDAAQQTAKLIEEAKPIAVSTVETISSAEPTLILGGLVVGYFLLPPVFSTVSFSLRGYQGDLSPAQALDLMSKKNYIMVDIRSEKDKGKAGIPRFPPSAKNKLISVPLEELPSKLQSLVRSAKKVEAEMVALKISYLKKINKGSNIVILDSI